LKRLILVIGIILCAHYAAGASFTGSYSDYGLDTNTDGLFEYLVVNVGVSTSSGDHSIFGELMDSQGHVHEYEVCQGFSSGTHTVPLYFDGTDIFLDGIDGPYDLSYIEVNTMASGCSGQPPAEPDDFVDDPYSTGYYAYTQFQPPAATQAGAYCTDSPCVADSSAINCAGDDEPNSPNTIDYCYDSDMGTCHVDESIENITVTSLSEDNFTVNDQVRIDIWVYCSSTFDHLNFIYTNNTDTPNWKYMGHEFCPSTGFVQLTKDITLDDAPGNHTIRGVFELGGSVTDTCGSVVNWADNDDVTILVHQISVQPKMKIPLSLGWNLMSFPSLSDDSIGTALAGINGKFDRLLMFNASEMQYYLHDTGDIPHSNLNSVTHEQGYWIHMSEAADLEIDYNESGNIIFDLEAGWNLIGYPSNRTVNIDNLFVDEENFINSILSFENDAWLLYHPDTGTGSLQLAKPGQGYWLYAKQAVTMIFDGSYFVFEQLTVNIPLAQGWNMLSLPISPSSATVGDVFSGIPHGKAFSVSSEWQEMNDNSVIDPSLGFWIYINSPGTLQVSGTPISGQMFNIRQGWNLISYPSTQPGNVNVLFNDVNTDINSIMMFDNGWKSYVFGRPVNTLTQIDPGQGVWVNVRSDQTWQFDSTYQFV